MIRSQVKEGKIELTAAIDGLFRVDTRRLNAVNLLEDIMIATRRGNTPVRAGDKLCLFELDGRPCGLIICYDLRFPELTRSMTLEGVDLLFVVAQWPEKRTMHLETLARARAIENQMFLALCNSVGAAGETRCGGHSAIIDPWDEYLAQAWDSEATITSELDFSVIEGIRSSINVFRDRRPELYKVST